MGKALNGVWKNGLGGHSGWNTIRNTIRDGGKAADRVWNTARMNRRFLEFLFSGVFRQRGGRVGGTLLRRIGGTRWTHWTHGTRLLRLGGSRDRLQPGQFYVSPIPRVSLLQASISAGEKGGAARSMGREKPSPLCFAMASCPHTQKSCHSRGEDTVPGRGKTRSSGTETPSKSE